MKARDNPFATSRILRVRYQLPGETWAQLMARLESLHYRAAIVGPHGSGKTTLLEDLEPHLQTRGFHLLRLRLDQQNPSFPTGFLDRHFCDLGPGDCILLDGADHLGWWSWSRCKRLGRSAGGLIVTSHRRGMLPTLLECQTSAELLARIVGELLGESSEQTAPLTDTLFRCHRGNLRDALRDLYDQHSRSRAYPAP